jgi:hypothetical protein
MIPIELTDAGIIEKEKEELLKNSIDYYVIDMYANGTEIIRGMKNTNTNIPLGTSQITQYTHPLRSDRFALFR